MEYILREIKRNAERIKEEMDAIEFVKQLRRMDGNAYRKYSVFLDSPEDVVDEVEKWAKEHPIKTRQSKFLEMFTNASLTINGTVYICPKALDKDRECFYRHYDHSDAKIIDCLECRKRFWLEEIE